MGTVSISRLHFTLVSKTLRLGSTLKNSSTNQFYIFEAEHLKYLTRMWVLKAQTCTCWFDITQPQRIVSGRLPLQFGHPLFKITASDRWQGLGGQLTLLMNQI